MADGRRQTKCAPSLIELSGLIEYCCLPRQNERIGIIAQKRIVEVEDARKVGDSPSDNGMMSS